MNTVGEKIRYFRKRKGFSQEDLAHELDVSLTAYSKIERNITDINFSRLLQIAKVLNVSLIQLLSVDKKGKTWSDENERLKEIIVEKDKKIMLLQQKIIKQFDKKSSKKK
ncbi:MAG TPA: helix-turn-helix transcriptional regulator [Bacteroidia bacterium]|jgi:transcriptional regulator with XRE-family HTH domain